MFVVGTAGHVDHGKSTLVRALTGIDPDRLREEKEREMTIDLGFAWITLPGDVQVGMVDVPGHRDFIENMLAGVGGVDAALFVIAADEGVMPQTREHLAILDLLEVPGGVIVLTKTDMIDDPEWLDLIEMDVREVMEGTVFDDVPIVRVSAQTGEGLPELQAVMVDVLSNLPARLEQGRPRLPVDRIFTIGGFGSVVTGTLAGGALHVGESIELQPGGHEGRIRGLQAYKTSLEHIDAGSRVAVNVTGIDKHDIKRGQVLTTPGWLRDTILVDVRFRHLPGANRALKHNTEVKFFSGAAESVARVRLLDTDTLEPGSEGWLQIRLEDPLALVRGDRFILRIPSPAETIGGGVVIDPAPGRRWRRHKPEVIQRLQTIAQGTPGELMAQTLARIGAPIRLKALQKQSDWSRDELESALREAHAENLIVDLDSGWWVATPTLGQIIASMERALKGYHQSEPLRRGMPREELRSRVQLERGAFDRIMTAVAGQFSMDDTLVWLPDHQVQLTHEQHAAVDDLLARFARSPYQPPSSKDSAALVGDDLFRYLIEQRALVVIAADVVLAAPVYDEFMHTVTETLDGAGEISARELRDSFDTTRKYAIAFLEHLDAHGITRREGDMRVWLRRPAS